MCKMTFFSLARQWTVEDEEEVERERRRRRVKSSNVTEPGDDLSPTTKDTPTSDSTFVSNSEMSQGLSRLF